MENAKKVNSDNFMSLVLESVVNSDNKPLPEAERLAQDAKQAEAVVKDFLKVLDKHQVSPMNGYLIASALADSIYFMLMDNIETQSTDL